MKREIQRIEPMSAVRVGFLVGLASGVVFGLLEAALFKTLSQSTGASFLPPEAADLVNLSGGGIIILAIVTGLFFSLVFAFLGAMTALLYNLAAHLFGGIEIFISGDEAPRADDTSPKSSWPENDDDA